LESNMNHIIQDNNMISLIQEQINIVQQTQKEDAQTFGDPLFTGNYVYLFLLMIQFVSLSSRILHQNL